MKTFRGGLHAIEFVWKHFGIGSVVLVFITGSQGHSKK